MKIFLAFIFVCYVVIVLADEYYEEMFNDNTALPEMLNDNTDRQVMYDDTTEPPEPPNVVLSVIRDFFLLPLEMVKYMFSEPTEPNDTEDSTE
ncbi:hypothetical protein PGB90_002391 [Kerria lacca]